MVRAIHWDLTRKWYDHERNESGMTMSRKECVKITTTKFCGTSVFESTMKLCLRTDLVITDERERERGRFMCVFATIDGYLLR